MGTPLRIVHLPQDANTTSDNHATIADMITGTTGTTESSKKSNATKSSKRAQPTSGSNSSSSASPSTAAPTTAAAAALTAVVLLLQQGKTEMSNGAAELKAQKHLDKAAVHYEAAVRIF
eukprot:3585438-Pyramimonas_sp.AAC.1